MDVIRSYNDPSLNRIGTVTMVSEPPPHRRFSPLHSPTPRLRPSQQPPPPPTVNGLPPPPLLHQNPQPQHYQLSDLNPSSTTLFGAYPLHPPPASYPSPPPKKPPLNATAAAASLCLSSQLINHQNPQYLCFRWGSDSPSSNSSTKRPSVPSSPSSDPNPITLDNYIYSSSHTNYSPQPPLHSSSVRPNASSIPSTQIIPKTVLDYYCDICLVDCSYKRYKYNKLQDYYLCIGCFTREESELRLNILDYSYIEDDERKFEVLEYHCNRCLFNCTDEHYCCSRFLDYNLCPICLTNGEFELGLAPRDFILVKAAKEEGMQVGNYVAPVNVLEEELEAREFLPMVRTDEDDAANNLSIPEPQRQVSEINYYVDEAHAPKQDELQPYLVKDLHGPRLIPPLLQPSSLFPTLSSTITSSTSSMFVGSSLKFSTSPCVRRNLQENPVVNSSNFNLIFSSSNCSRGIQPNVIDCYLKFLVRLCHIYDPGGEHMKGILKLITIRSFPHSYARSVCAIALSISFLYLSVFVKGPKQLKPWLFNNVETQNGSTYDEWDILSPKQIKDYGESIIQDVELSVTIQGISLKNRRKILLDITDPLEANELIRPENEASPSQIVHQDNPLNADIHRANKMALSQPTTEDANFADSHYRVQLREGLDDDASIVTTAMVEEGVNINLFVSKMAQKSSNTEIFSCDRVLKADNERPDNNVEVVGSSQDILIFDGHNGNSAPIYVKGNNLNNVLSALPSGLSRDEWLAALQRALVEAFVKTDKAFQEKGQTLGTTVTFVIIDGWVVTVASVGDSRCIIESAEGTIYSLSADHRLDTNEEEMQRVTASRGEVGKLNVAGGAKIGPLRCWSGGLCLSRSIGDCKVGEFIVPIPHVKQVKLSNAGESRLRTGAYKTWNEIVRCSTKETAPTIMQLVPAIMMLRKTLEAQKLSSDEGEKQKEMQGLFCRCLQVITLKLGSVESTKYVFLQYDDQMMMDLFLGVFACRNSPGHEGARLLLLLEPSPMLEEKILQSKCHSFIPIGKWVLKILKSISTSSLHLIFDPGGGHMEGIFEFITMWRCSSMGL